MEIYCLEAGCIGGWAFARGTSFASPFWAGLEADRSDGCTSQTGLFNPALYALYSQGAYGTAFTDIKSGDNDLIGGGTNVGQYPALNGYDLASGIGSPIAGGLSCPEVSSVTPGQSGHQVVVTGLGLEHATISFGGRCGVCGPRHGLCDRRDRGGPGRKRDGHGRRHQRARHRDEHGAVHLSGDHHHFTRGRSGRPARTRRPWPPSGSPHRNRGRQRRGRCPRVSR